MLTKINTLLIVLMAAVLSVYAQEKGKIAGKVQDAGTSEELIGVAVGIKGSSAGASTDLEGHFLLTLAPGTYTVVVSYVGYGTEEITDVEVKSGETVSLNVALKEATTELEEVVVTGKLESTSTNALLLEQKNSVSVSSGVSADLIRKTPDRTTADVMKRVSGASIQDGRYAIIRGLNERYNTAMLNGTILPSTESDRKAFSFDIVPSALIDKLTINKSFTPDMPADVAGGLIQITTKDIPDENKQTIQLGIGYNSITTGQGFYHGVKGKYDWLGFDDGSRAVPQGVGTTEENLGMRPTDLKVLGTEQAKTLWTHNYTPLYDTKARPNVAFQYSLARRYKVLKNDFGVLFALTYNNNLRYDPQANNIIMPGSLDNASYYTGKFYRNQVLGGGILNLSYKVGENSKFSLKNLFNINSESYSLLREGVQRPNTPENTVNRKEAAFYFHSNKMLSSQFAGEHFLPSSKVKVNYALGFNNIDRQVPDYRRISYETSPTVNDDGSYGQTPYAINFSSNQGNFNSATGASRYFSTLNERSVSASYDVKIPVPLPFKTEVKVGGFHQYRYRDFRYRTFVYRTQRTGFVSELPPDQVFVDANFNTSRTGLTLIEDNLYSWYLADSRLNAFYGMIDNKFSGFFRAIYGVRAEQFRQTVITRDQTADTSNTVNDNLDFLPSATLIFSLSEKMNVKTSYAKTLNRPEFRELSPTQFFDFYTQSLMQGAVGLKRAVIKNYDLRWEFYPTASEVFSISPFYKDFFDPIENVAVSNEAVRQFTKANQTSAKAYGIELEARKNLRELDNLFGTRLFQRFVIYGNYTYIKSKVKLDDPNIDQTLKDKGRPMQGQSPYIINAGILYTDEDHNWSLAFSLNRAGDRIYMVNQIYNQMIWEAARTVVDARVSKTFFKKLEASVTFGDLLAGGLRIGSLINLPAQQLIFYNDVDANQKYNSDKDLVQFGYSPSLGISNLGYNMTFSLAYNFR